MSKGNNNTYGNKKMNFPFQQALLQINGLIQAATAAGATEATLQLILTALQNGQDYEAKLVRDSDTPPVNWLEVRIFNQTTGIFDPPIYYLAGSNIVGSPVLPVVYIDPTTLLATIASNTTGLATQATLASLNAKFNSLGQKASAASTPVVLSTEQEALIDGIEALLTTIDADTSNLDVALSTRATEATLLATNVLLTTIDTVLDNILLDTANLDVLLSTRNAEATQLLVDANLTLLNTKLNTLGQKASAASAPVVLSTEQEVILNAIKTAVEALDLDADGLASETTLLVTNSLLTTIDTVLDNILLDTAAIDTATTGLNTPVTGLATANLRVTGAGAASVAAGKRRVTFFNAGNADTTVAGATLKRGEVVTFSADGLRDTLALISYDALTSELLISTVG